MQQSSDLVAHPSSENILKINPCLIHPTSASNIFNMGGSPLIKGGQPLRMNVVAFKKGKNKNTKLFIMSIFISLHVIMV